MMIKRIVFLVVAVLAFSAGRACADTFVWQDPVNDYTISFPDSWRVQTAKQPDMTLRIAGPLAEDIATCAVEVKKDGRLQIYPKRLMAVAVDEKLDKDFWQKEIGQFQDARIADYYAPAGLGNRGDATAIHVSFTQDDGHGKKIAMYGTMIGSIYADTLYVAQCSARQDAFNRYNTLFGGIFNSVNLKSKYAPFATGYYRDFLADVQFEPVTSKPGTRDPYASPLARFFRFK